MIITISSSLRLSPIFNGIIIKGITGHIVSSLLNSMSSKLPMIASILVGSFFSTSPVQNKGSIFIRSILSGATDHLTLLTEPECMTVMGMSPQS